MTLRYNLTGADRKRLVTAISEITGAPAKWFYFFNFKPSLNASPTRSVTL